ncbi:MAG: DNA-binding response regulator [Chloroflexi bacterium]|nr:MAG: DNA-binding response regulator [Chloroflexota bacterium]
MTEEIRILIADDHGVVREGLRALIRTEKGMKLLGEAENGEQALTLARQLQPDILLLDMIMPGVSGLDVIRELKREAAPIRILVLTSFSDDEMVFSAIKNGADGYLLKNTPPKTLLSAIRDVHSGSPSMSPSIAMKLMRELQRPPDLPPTEEPLTGREVDVLRLIAQGCSNEEIAEQLVVTEGTVRSHVSNILTKLHLANRTQAALYALREGLASL